MTHVNLSAAGIPENVLNVYMLAHNADRERADAIFVELHKFFCVASLSNVRCSPSRVVDEAWHVFLEHDQAYKEYFALAGQKPLKHIVRAESSPSAYAATRELIRTNFLEPDERFWPCQSDASTCSPCDSE